MASKIDRDRTISGMGLHCMSQYLGLLRCGILAVIYYSKFDRDHVLCITFCSANVQIHDRVCTPYIEYYL